MIRLVLDNIYETVFSLGARPLTNNYMVNGYGPLCRISYEIGNNFIDGCGLKEAYIQLGRFRPIETKSHYVSRTAFDWLFFIITN